MNRPADFNIFREKYFHRPERKEWIAESFADYMKQEREHEESLHHH